MVQLYITTIVGGCKGGIFIFYKKNIKNYIKNNNYTQKSFSIFCGLPLRTIENIISANTKNLPSLESIINISNAINITIDDLLFKDIYN